MFSSILPYYLDILTQTYCTSSALNCFYLNITSRSFFPSFFPSLSTRLSHSILHSFTLFLSLPYFISLCLSLMISLSSFHFLLPTWQESESFQPDEPVDALAIQRGPVCLDIRNIYTTYHTTSYILIKWYYINVIIFIQHIVQHYIYW